MRISKIRRVPYSGPVYNFHCTPDENYVADSLLVHNCYKSNGTGEPVHMSLGMFKEILEKIRTPLTQIAFGITDIYDNPDFFWIMQAARDAGIVPNYTTSALDLDDEAVKKTAELCGAVAVSVVDENACFDAISRFTRAGMSQVNIHFVLARETFGKAVRLIDKAKHDPRLEKLNAIVFLAYKPKGRNPDMWKPLQAVEEYEELIAHCEEAKINYGFDSCSAPMVLRARPKHKEFIEPCESGLFSTYISADGDCFPCSFAEQAHEWETGIDVLSAEDFVKDVWMSPRMQAWREGLLKSSQGCDCPMKDGCRSCPIYPVTACKKETR